MQIMQLQFSMMELSVFIKWIRLSVFTFYRCVVILVIPCPKWFVIFETDYKCHLDVHI